MNALSADIQIRRGAFKLHAAFEAPLGGVTAIFGPSGAGKSMLLAALAGLRRLDAGRVVLGARVLDDVAARVHVPAHQRGVGLVFQNTRLFPHLSVGDNLRYAERRAKDVRPLTTLDAAATDFDIAPLLTRPVRNLSGGERSRVALARALLAAPELLLLDEPFAALDGPRRSAFLNSLRATHVKFALPLIVVTHQIEDAAALADHLVGVKDGKVIAAGLLSEVATSPPFRALLDPRDIGAAVPASAFHGGGTERSAHWIRADHVLLASQKPVGLSARNVWEARIIDMENEHGSFLVRLEAPFGAVFARITPEAAAELALAPGQNVWAIVKAHAR
jgi:molybdate transport system ATP-binding protein